MDNLKAIKKIARQQRLAREHSVGRPRAKSWSGKPDASQARRDWKRQARDLS